MITRARVDGMTCQHCVRAVFTALAGVEGITRAKVSIGALEVEHDGRLEEQQLRSAVELAGYRLGEVGVSRRELPVR